MTSTTRTKLVSAAAGLAMAAGSLGVGAALAAPAGAATTPASSTPAHNGAARTWVRDHRRQIRRAVVAVSSKAIGITPATLVTDLKAGSSIAQVAASHGVSASTVEGDLVSYADAKVAKAVADHKLTQAQGQKIDARLPALADRVVTHVFGQHSATTHTAA